MRLHRLDDMTRGWFIGDFTPTALATGAVEVAVKSFRAGDAETCHVHRVASEVTAVVSGSVRMAGAVLHAGDVVVLAPGEFCDFQAGTDAVVVSVKVPGAGDDKHLCEQGHGPGGHVAAGDGS